MKMTGRSCHGDEIWETEIEEEEEEEEALSFCDLPVKEKQQAMRTSSSAAVETEEFDFKQWRPAPPMLAADELFFQGQMLPLRLSFSSENRQSNINELFGGNLWNRSESMDHNMLRFRNGSCSSSSSRSHYSRSSSHSNNSVSIPTNSKPRTQKNVFHSHPSPTPQIRSFSTSSHRSRSRSSSRWEFFRLGLLRTPGMELQDLKTRTTTTTATGTAAHKTTASILGVVSCKKSVDAVPATAAKNRIRNEKVLNNNNNNNNSVEIREKEKEKERRVSHRRTFEWLKQLSHATFGEEQ
ncbi:unnamed protein product [Citrullus colocynthis]|uniref:Uncharacterized protein n=1 Tax=Citrullus colocynthis TaxID=252529 RepID=A0ABP0Y8H7_9ROSI